VHPEYEVLSKNVYSGIVVIVLPERSRLTYLFGAWLSVVLRVEMLLTFNATLYAVAAVLADLLDRYVSKALMLVNAKGRVSVCAGSRAQVLVSVPSISFVTQLPQICPSADTVRVAVYDGSWVQLPVSIPVSVQVGTVV